LAFCTQSVELGNNRIIKPINDPESMDQSAHIDLQGHNLNELTFLPISKALSKIGPHIFSLDVSFNPLFKDSCVVYMKKVLQTSVNLNYLSLEKTGITDHGALTIIECLTVTNTIRSLNIGSNKLGEQFIEGLAQVFEEDKLQILEDLNISNLNLNEKDAITLLTSLVQYSNIEKLNLSMNQLKHKVGTHLLNLLAGEGTLKHINLLYNPMGKSLLEAIELELAKRQNEANKTLTNQEEITGINPVMNSDNKKCGYKSIIETDTRTQNYTEEVLGDQIPVDTIKTITHEELNFPKAFNGHKEELKDDEEYGVEEECDSVRYDKDTKYKAIFNEISSYSNNEGVKPNIKDVHPFYSRKHKYSSENLSSSNKERSMLGNESSFSRLEDSYVTSTAKKVPQLTEIEEAKVILQERVYELLQYYATLDSSFVSSYISKDNALDLAQKLIEKYRGLVVEKSAESGTKLIEKEFNKRFGGRFINRRDSQYTTTDKKKVATRRHFSKKNISWRKNEEQVYKQILKQYRNVN
jgi:hypothetical protein